MSKAVHPNSRQAKRMMRSALRSDRISKKKSLYRRTQQQPQINKLLWFQANMDPEKACYTHPEMIELIEQYLRRNDDELAELHEANTRTRNQRPKGVREDLLRSQVHAEEQLFENGNLRCPDLTRKATCAYLREWDGALKWVEAVEMMAFKRPKRKKAPADGDEAATSEDAPDTAAGSGD